LKFHLHSGRVRPTATCHHRILAGTARMTDTTTTTKD
jgi:hypothetical protein